MPENTQPNVAIVGSPSTNFNLTLDLLDAAADHPLVGNMLAVETPLGGQTELALGTVTEVTTTNQWHQNPAMRGVIRDHGFIENMSGRSGDIRAASVKLQACYARNTGQPWRQSGPALRMSPSTGTPVRVVDNDLIADLMAGEPDLHYLGNLHGTDVRIPMNIRDFSGDRGAFHTGVFGLSGSGKTQMAAYILAGQMRHPNHGTIIIDPQGQFASETGMAFSLQGWAAELGREVMVRRISEDLRLEKDAPLFGELLGKTKFLRELMKMSTETQEILIDELAKVLRAIPNWTDKPSQDLMEDLLRGLREPNVLRRVYADGTRQIRLMLALSEILGDLPDENPDGTEIVPGTYTLPDPQVLRMRHRDVLSQFAPLHNLFAPTNPSGATRHSLWGTISRVFDKAARNGRPAPLLILDMSTSGRVSWLNDLLHDEEDERVAMDAIRILDQDNIKAAILRQTCRTLKTASEAAFRDGDNLNTNVVLDEAWRYVPPPAHAMDEEIKALSIDMAGYFRDTRKFGIGWTLISQTPRSVSPDCFDQMSIRVIGYGLGGADLAKIGEQLDDPDHLKLYRAFSPPDATRPKIYPFMIAGPVSPLSFTKAPVFLSAYTDFDTFRVDNAEWIEHARRAMGQQPLTGTPLRPGGEGPSAPISAARIAAPRRAPARVAAQQAERVRVNAGTGGVDPSAGTGLSRDSGFSNGLGAIDDSTFEEPPF